MAVRESVGFLDDLLKSVLKTKAGIIKNIIILKM